jgi:hypothetical protein
MPTENGGSQGAEPEFEWERETPDSWRSVVDGWRWLDIGHGAWQKSGECPRCEHGMTVEKQGAYAVAIDRAAPVDTDLLRAAQEETIRIDSPEGPRSYARCNCARSTQAARARSQLAAGRPPTSNRRQAMSSGAAAALIVGTAVLAVMLVILIQTVRNLSADAKPADWASSTAAAEWEEKTAKARDDFGLAQIRTTATTWGATIASLLGILGTVAVVAGPDALVDDVGGTEADIAAWLILAAGAVAAVAGPARDPRRAGDPEARGQPRRLDLPEPHRAASRPGRQPALRLALPRRRGALDDPPRLRDRLDGGADRRVGARHAGGDRRDRRRGSLRHPGSADGALALTVGESVTPVGTRSELTLVDSCP